jgi:hypothetical protein
MREGAAPVSAVYQALKRILKHYAAQASAAADKPPLQQHGEHIRQISEYQAFWDEYCQIATPGSHEPNPSTTTHP